MKDKYGRARMGKWDKRHLMTVSTHLTTRQYDTLKDACNAAGTTPYAIVRDFLRDYIAKYESSAERKESGIISVRVFGQPDRLQKI